jgi:hypothetical protein
MTVKSPIPVGLVNIATSLACDLIVLYFDLCLSDLVDLVLLGRTRTSCYFLTRAWNRVPRCFINGSRDNCRN